MSIWTAGAWISEDPAQDATGSATAIVRPPASGLPQRASENVRMTLEQAWADVAQQFFEQTGRHLMSSGAREKAGVLQTWQEKYRRDDSSESTRKLDRMRNILQTVLDGVEVIGAFAAQAASTVFAPAGMCFNALAFLIDAPRQIKKVYDGLRELFDEISDFLIKFKILKRIDDEVALDEDLVVNTNRILMSFVRICILSIRLLEGSKFGTAAKVIFLKNDSGISAELATFRRLTQSQNMLTGTVTLEHILRSEQDVKAILESSSDTHTKVSWLAAARKDEQTRLLNRERLAIIQRKLFTYAELSGVGKYPSPQPCTERLPGTLDMVEADPNFRQWMEKGTSEPRAMMLLGGTGTGKSFVLEALREKFENIRRDGPDDDPSLYICSCDFSMRTQQVENAGVDLPTTYVLRRMAFQVATQAPAYARALERHLQQYSDLQSIDSVDQLWAVLKLDNLPARPGSTLVMLLDGVEQAAESIVKTLLDMVLDYGKNGKSQSVPGVRLRVLLAGTTTHFGHAIPTVSLEGINKSLLGAFIAKEVKRLRIFQDTDRRSLHQRSIVLKELPQQSDGSFHVARQKLEMLCQAVNQDAPVGELSHIMACKVTPDDNEDSQEVVHELESCLSSKQIEQLNSLLMWIVYIQRSTEFSLAELEAAQYLSLDKETLEPLVNKLRQRFEKVFFRVSGFHDVRFGVRVPILRILKKTEDDREQASPANAPLFSLTVSLQNAPEEDIRRFVWDLNEQMISGKFDFSKPKNALQKPRIQIHKLKAHYTIVILCLKLLNEAPQEATRALIPYARDYLPKHLTELQQVFPQISSEDRSVVAQGLIQYLSAPYYVEHECESFGNGTNWLTSSTDVDSTLHWICYAATLAQIPSRERRWAQKVSQSARSYDFVEDIASAVARRWSGQNRPDRQPRLFPMCDFGEMYQWLKSFIEGQAAIFSPRSASPSETLIDAGNEGSSLQTPTKNTSKTLLERTTEIVDWVQNRVADDSKDRRYMLMAGALYCEGEFPTAIKYFKKCEEGTNHLWRALQGIAYSYSRLDDTKALLSTRQEIVDILGRQKELQNLDEDGLEEYASTLRQLAYGYEQLNQHGQAVVLLKKALIERPHHSNTRWRIVQALNNARRCEEVMALLDDWTENPVDHGGKRPAESLLELAEQDLFRSQVIDVVRDIHDENVRLCLLGVLQKSAQLGKDLQSFKHTEMVFCQSIAAVMSPDAQLRKTGVDLLEELVQYSAPPGAESSNAWSKIVSEACEYLAKQKFDEQRHKAVPQSSLSHTTTKSVAAELISYIYSTVKAAPDLPPMKLIQGPDIYIASLYSAIGRDAWARQYFAEAVVGYLEILADDDPDNDLPAIENMIRIFCITNDRINAMIAWSLLDRKEALGIYYSCCFCGHGILSRDLAGVWLCRFCSNFTICNKCHGEKTRAKEYWNTYQCNPDHEWIYLHHWNYSDEEVMTDMLRVDFKVETIEGEATRIGGRVVDISIWLEQIRSKWGLETSSSVIRGLDEL